MIETFFVSQLYNKMKEDDSSEGNEGIVFIIKMGLIILATHLAWECNKNSDNVYKIGVPTFAFFFSIIYLMYYGIYRKLMNKPCVNRINEFM